MLQTNSRSENKENFLTRVSTVVKSMVTDQGIESEVIFVIVYVAYIYLDEDLEDACDLQKYLEKNCTERRYMFVEQMLGGDASLAVRLAEKLDKDELLDYMRWFNFIVGRTSWDRAVTPESLVKLAVRILGIENKDTVADLGCGAGGFLMMASNENPDASYYGLDIHSAVSEIAMIRSELFMENTIIEQGDMFNISNDIKYDKVFSNYPFGIRIRSFQTGQNYLDKIRRRAPEIKRVTSADWVYNSVVMDHLKDNGKAVTIMTNGSTWNTLDMQTREYFVKNGYIEAVIALPAKLFSGTMVATSMVVLSHGNDKVRMIDASNLFELGRRVNELNENHIEKIIKCFSEDSDIAVSVDKKDLKENDFVLYPSRYMKTDIEIKNGVKFGTLIKRATRGAQVKASDLDGLMSEEPTDTQYLMLSNIQDGIIDDNLPYLRDLNPKLEKYLIKKGNLLLSKNGAPFKVAVAEFDEDKTVLGNGNLYIIELDKERVNPYYLKAFFDSELGTASLSTIAVGASIPNLPLKSLENLTIPLPPLNEQDKIALDYQAKEDEIKVLKLKLQRAKDDLKSIFKGVE